MSNTSATFHGITSISVKYCEAPGVQFMHFVFRGADGGFHDVNVHVAGPVEIDGAEYVNFIAAHEKEQPDSLVPLLQASIDAVKAKKGEHA